MAAPRFIPSRLDEVERVEEYTPGGFHPIRIGDVFANKRYQILHKIGFGGSSTIWLARDHQKDSSSRLVTLKAMRADISVNATDDTPDLAIPKKLRAAFPESDGDFQTVEDHFIVNGPNGSHRFLILPFTGPNVLALSDSPGRTTGSRRLRGDISRKVAMQVAATVYRMHSIGLVHGDLTTSNILFRLSEHVAGWSNAQVYDHLGYPQTEEVRTRNGEPRGPHVPTELVSCVENTRLAHGLPLRDSVTLIDFGQSYVVASPPRNYQPGTSMSNLPPETRFEGRAGFKADVWMLGCTIFEIRAGRPLFDSFFGSDTDILKQTVEVLGRLPDPWWAQFVEHAQWFEEDGTPKSEEAQELAGVLLKSCKSSIREQLCEIGTSDDPPDADEGQMIDKFGVKLQDEEVNLLEDLLGKTLKYRPEERIEMREVFGHPWFRFHES